MLVRQRRLLAAGSAGRGVPRRRVRLRHVRLRDQRPGVPALDRRRRELHRHDVGRDDESDAGRLRAVSRTRSRRTGCIRTSTRSSRFRARTPRSSARTAVSSARAGASRTSRRSATSAALERERAWHSASSCSRRCPTQLFNLNKGLSTLQFQSLSVAADNPKHLQGGTQDNGTFETTGSSVVWPQIMYGDGGQSGLQRRRTRRSGSTRSPGRRRRELPERRPDEVGHHRRSDRVQPGERAVLRADASPIRIRRMRARSSRARTASGAPRTGAATRRSSRRTAPSSRPRRANPACGDFVRIGPAGDDEPDRIERDRTTAARPRRRQRRGDRAGAERHGHDVGGDDDRPRLHLEERQRGGRQR